MAIKIKKKNRGKFTRYAKRKGMTTKKGRPSSKAVSTGLKSKNPKTRSRANFARMAKRGWKPLGKSTKKKSTKRRRR